MSTLQALSMPLPITQKQAYTVAEWMKSNFGPAIDKAIKTDEAFFRERKWYDIDECLNRVMKELAGKYKAQKDVWKAVRAYNGSGAGAARYVNNVVQFASYSGEVV